MAANLLIVGFATDSTIRHVLGTAVGTGVETALLELEEFYATGAIDWSSNDPEETVVYVGDLAFRLGEFDAIYQRASPPDLESLSMENAAHCRALSAALHIALSTSPATVVNRPRAGWENSSKLLQLSLLKSAGFDVPPSLSTSFSADLIAWARHDDLIYKSNSGTRSIVSSVNPEHIQRADELDKCGVLFQRHIRGVDVRVHVVKGEALAVAIESDAVDYRYYRRCGTYAKMRPLPDLPRHISDLCISYAGSRGVDIAGFDFKCADGVWYCLEMNPSPAFAYFDDSLEGRIAARLVDLLIHKAHHA